MNIITFCVFLKVNIIEIYYMIISYRITIFISGELDLIALKEFYIFLYFVLQRLLFK